METPGLSAGALCHHNVTYLREMGGQGQRLEGQGQRQGQRQRRGGQREAKTTLGQGVCAGSRT